MSRRSGGKRRKAVQRGANKQGQGENDGDQKKRKAEKETEVSQASGSNGESKAKKRCESSASSSSTETQDFPVPRRGIAWSSNSCYVDSTLFALFATTRIFDGILIQNPSIKTAHRGARVTTTTVHDDQFLEDQKKMEIRGLLHDIVVTNLRSKEGFCPAHKVQNLRRYLATHFNPRMTTIMLDAEEFMATLFRRALRLDPFVQFEGGGSNFLYTIFVEGKIDPLEYSDTGPTIWDLQTCLKVSMSCNNLQFSTLPSPALIIKMPRSNGKLHPGLDGVLPNLVLDVTSMLKIDEGEDPRARRNGQNLFHLLAVICLRSCHYTSFVRKGLDLSSSWYYFDSIGPSVSESRGLGQKLNDFEADLKSKDFRKADVGQVAQILSTCHICIYVPYDPSDPSSTLVEVREGLDPKHQDDLSNEDEDGRPKSNSSEYSDAKPSGGDFSSRSEVDLESNDSGEVSRPPSISTTTDAGDIWSSALDLSVNPHDDDSVDHHRDLNMDRHDNHGIGTENNGSRITTAPVTRLLDTPTVDIVSIFDGTGSILIKPQNGNVIIENEQALNIESSDDNSDPATIVDSVSTMGEVKEQAASPPPDWSTPVWSYFSSHSNMDHLEDHRHPEVDSTASSVAGSPKMESGTSKFGPGPVFAQETRSPIEIHEKPDNVQIAMADSDESESENVETSPLSMSRNMGGGGAIFQISWKILGGFSTLVLLLVIVLVILLVLLRL